MAETIKGCDEKRCTGHPITNAKVSAPPEATPPAIAMAAVSDATDIVRNPKMAAMITVSDQLRVVTETRRNRNAGEMVPVNLGNFILKVAAKEASPRHT